MVEEKTDVVSVITKINKMLVENKVTAREILHIARELETNATISVVFANLIQNVKTGEEPKKDKGIRKP